MLCSLFKVPCKLTLKQDQERGQNRSKTDVQELMQQENIKEIRTGRIQAVGSFNQELFCK